MILFLNDSENKKITLNDDFEKTSPHYFDYTVTILKLSMEISIILI
jgi:hypothetical protein